MTASALRKGKPVKRGRSSGLIIALIALFVLAAAGYFGFMWWQGREAGRVAEPVIARPVTPPPATPAAPDRATDTAGTGAAERVADGPATPTSTSARVEPLPTAVPAPAVVTPAPATATAATAPTPTRARLDAQAREYAANPSGNFTIQSQILCDPGNLEQLARSGGGEIWFVPQMLGTRSCYRVFYGRFDDRASAQQGLASVPAAIRDRNAAVRPVPR